MDPNFPLRRAVTRGFRSGVPRNLNVSRDGDSVLFLRSAAGDNPTNDLWRLSWNGGEATETLLVDAQSLLGSDAEELPPAEKARRERLRESSAGITAFSVDPHHERVCFALSGQLWIHDLHSGISFQRSEAPVSVPTMDPTGNRVAFVCDGTVQVVSATDPAATNTTDASTAVVLCESSAPTVSWGEAEFIAAEEMGRYRGFWWSPDGQQLLATRVDEAAVPVWWIGDPAQPQSAPRETRYPAAGSQNAEVQLFVVTLTGEQTEVIWDREGFEYLARVHWGEHGDPIIAVQSRDQRTLRILRVDPTTGQTDIVSERHETPWIELIPGVPARTRLGIIDVVVDEATDTKRLALLPQEPPTQDHSSTGPQPSYLTPPGLQVRAITSDTGLADPDASITCVASADATTQDLYRVTGDGQVKLMSESGGWATGTMRGGTAAIARADPDHPRSEVSIRRAERTATLRNLSEVPGPHPEPQWLRVGTRDPNTAILWPSDPASFDKPLPIIMSPYGGPHAQRAIRASAAFLTEQWFADQGFCVVISDGPGTPRSPSFEAEMAGDLATPALQGQVDALEAVVAEFGDRVDADHVGIRGWSFGGFLAALAVLDRPDLFHAAVAGAPVTDWALYDTHYTERYLGTPQRNPAAYQRSGLIDRADQLLRPLLLIHGLSDDNVFAANTLQLSSALLAAGRSHQVLPLTGVTHMTPQEVVAENLLKLDFQFLDSALRPTNPPAAATAATVAADPLDLENTGALDGH